MSKRLLMLFILTFFMAGGAEALPIVYKAELSGAAESPPNVSPGTGFTTVTYDPALGTLRVEVSFSGLLGITTVAHIHCCTAVPEAGTVGVATMLPTFAGFPAGVASGTYDQTFDLSLASAFSSAFISGNGGTPAGAEAALAAGLAGGRAYLNIHSDIFPGGEIRGFLAVPEPSVLPLLGAGLLALALRQRQALRHRA